MAIDPTTTTTVKVSELASAGYNTTDLIPHEVAGILKKGNLQDLATFIGGIISTEGAVGFRAVTVTDGQTLPATTEEEFILVGPGTYPNVGGGSAITTTEPLNALVSNGTYWFIGVEIPIGATGVWGTISGTLDDQTDLKDVLDLKADLVDGKVPASQLPSYVDDVVEVANYAALPSTGETGKIYLTLDNNKIYRWSGSAYIEIADNNAVWGMITGTLSDQTDLNTALGLKVPYTGATGNVDLGSHKLTASDLVVNHTSGSGTAATISKGGNGEALTVTKSSGSGNVASFSGGVTSISELHLTTDLADAYIASAATWNAKQSALTFSSPLVNTSGTISIPVASGSANGYLSSTDWNTFNGKQAALNGTGFVKASGTTISYDNTTYVPTSRRLTINGTDYDLTADRSWTILSGAWGYISGTLSDQEDLQAALDLKATDASVVKITTDQNIRGIKTFLGNQTATTLKLIVADYYNDGIITSDNGMLRLLNGTTELFNLASTGDLTAKSFIKSGGTSSQYLMADGSVSTGSGGTVTGTGTTNYIPKFTGASAIGNSLIYDDGTNVGIGTATPLTGGGAAKWLTLEGTTYSGGIIGSVNGVAKFYNYFDNASNTAALQGASGVGVTLWTDSAERMRITSNGQVNIGSTSFAGDELLMVSMNGTTNTQAINVKDRNASGNGSTFMVFRKSDDTFLGNIRRSGTSDALYIGGNSFLALGHSGNTEAMRITSGGNVGIGTTSPAVKFHSYGGALTVGDESSYSARFSNNSNKGVVIGYDSTNNKGHIGCINPAVAWTDLILNANGGNVGIGTTSPTSKLHLYLADGANDNVLKIQQGTNAYASGINIIANNDGGAVYNFINSQTNGGTEHWRIGGGATASTMTISTGGSERMRITSGGIVLVNQTGLSAAGAGTKMQVATDMLTTGSLAGYFFENRSGGVTSSSNWYGWYATSGVVHLWNGASNLLSITGTTGATTFTSTVTATGFFNSSDNRLKDLIDYDYNVSDIKPITYLWKDGRDNKKHVGYSAQEVQKVMPDAVNEDADGMLSVNYVEVLVAQVELLNNRMAEMQKEIELLKSK